MRDEERNVVSTSPLRSGIVAVIEDDVAMLAGLKRMLSAVGYASESFASAEEFLAWPAAPDVMCLIVDINLGRMSGIELGRRLKASGRSIPLIFITARDDEATHRDAAAIGYSAYLRKPFAGKALVDALRQAARI